MEAAPMAPAEDTSLGVAIAAEVLALMGRHRCSQKKLAGVLNLSQPSLSKRLAGIVPWDVDELDTIASYFNDNLIDMLSRAIQTITRWNANSAGLSAVTAAGQMELPFTIDRFLSLV